MPIQPVAFPAQLGSTRFQMTRVGIPAGFQFALSVLMDDFLLKPIQAAVSFVLSKISEQSSMEPVLRLVDTRSLRHLCGR
jgi:hypothetical protein